MTRSSLAQGRGTKHASHLRTTWMHPPPPCYMTRLLPTHQPFRMRLPFGGREASSMCSQVWSIGVSSDSKHTRMKRFEVSSCLRHGVNKMQATHVLTCLMSSHVSCPDMSSLSRVYDMRAILHVFDSRVKHPSPMLFGSIACARLPKR
jgi:hypothetical protein